MKNKYFNIIIIAVVILSVYLIFMRNMPYDSIIEEGFEDNRDAALRENIQTLYKKFTDFMTNFCPIWEKSIITSASLNIEQAPLQSPTDTVSQNTPPTLSKSQLNTHIAKLKVETGKDLPSICSVSYPDALDLYDMGRLQGLTDSIPDSSTPYINALEWMNDNLKKSQENLKSALQGLAVETFQNCDELQKCIEEGNKKKENTVLTNLKNKLEKFFGDSAKLNLLMSENQKLVNNAENIKKRAESGAILNDLKLKDDRELPKFTPPPGAFKLEEMKRDNPQRYDELKRQNPELVGLKTMLEGINTRFR